MNTNARNRQSAGQPTGGQFATEARGTDTGVALDASTAVPARYQWWSDDPALRGNVGDALSGTPFAGDVLAARQSEPGDVFALVRPHTSRHGEMYELHATGGTSRIEAVAPDHWADDPDFPDDVGGVHYWSVTSDDNDPLDTMRKSAEKEWSNDLTPTLYGHIANHRVDSPTLHDPVYVGKTEMGDQCWEAETDNADILVRFSQTQTESEAAYVDPDSGHLIDYRTFQQIAPDWERENKAAIRDFCVQYRALTED